MLVMTRPIPPSSRTARALAWLLLLLAAQALPAAAATYCVDSVSGVVGAIDAAQHEDTTINVVSGTYAFGQFGIDELAQHDVRLIGGWNAGCTSRQLDPRLTVFTAAADKRLDVFSYESIRIESIAFIGAGRVVLSAGWPGGGGDTHLNLERVWFQDLCSGGAPCDDLFQSWASIGLGAEHVRRARR